MKILLVRPKPKNIFAKLQTVRFEPLELEYLAAVVREANHHYQIYDGLLEKKPFAKYITEYQPDVVAITGYTIHVNMIKEYAETVKGYDDKIKVVTGGIHAEINWQDFYDENIDIIIHANPIETFKKLLESIGNGFKIANINNICFKRAGQWLKTEAEPFNPDRLPRPDRTHLNINKSKFRYFGKEQCALVKTAWGCSYNCNFCYCARLNGGHYSPRNIEKVIEEIQAIQQDKIFIVDDDFLVDSKRVLRFCQLIKEKGLKKDFSIYGRADLICRNEGILPDLKEAGVAKIIVGLEACDDKTLADYNKHTTAGINLKAVKLLRKYGIAGCGLFIVNENYSKKDFKRLINTVNKMELDLCMFSIFTPLKGVPGYEDYKEKLIIPEDKYENTDFLHLNIKPTKLSIRQFYFEFYKLYVLAYLNPKRLKRNFKPLITSLFNLLRARLNV